MASASQSSGQQSKPQSAQSTSPLSMHRHFNIDKSKGKKSSAYAFSVTYSWRSMQRSFANQNLSVRNRHDGRVQFRPNGKILKNLTIFAWAWDRVRGGLHEVGQSICQITPGTCTAPTDNSPTSRTPNRRPSNAASSFGSCLSFRHISISFSSTCRFLPSNFSNSIINMYLIGCFPITFNLAYTMSCIYFELNTWTCTMPPLQSGPN